MCVAVLSNLRLSQQQGEGTYHIYMYMYNQQVSWVTSSWKRPILSTACVCKFPKIKKIKKINHLHTYPNIYSLPSHVPHHPRAEPRQARAEEAPAKVSPCPTSPYFPDASHTLAPPKSPHPSTQPAARYRGGALRGCVTPQSVRSEEEWDITTAVALLNCSAWSAATHPLSLSLYPIR